jgi:hypothetical protein
MTRDSLKGQKLVALFLLGFLLMNYPILSLFNLDKLFFGIPILFYHLFAAWLMLIVLTIWITLSRREVTGTPDQQPPS